MLLNVTIITFSCDHSSLVSSTIGCPIIGKKNAIAWLNKWVHSFVADFPAGQFLEVPVSGTKGQC